MRHSRHSRKGGSSYMSRLMRRTRNTFRQIKHHARPHIKHVMPFLRRTAKRFGLGSRRRKSHRRMSHRRMSHRRGLGAMRRTRRRGGSTYNQRLNRRVKNSFSKIYDNVKPYIKKYAPRVVEALARRAGVGSRRRTMRRKSRRCGCSLYGGALQVAGYGARSSRGRRGRGMTRRRRR
jgi:hypothetical protein